MTKKMIGGQFSGVSIRTRPKVTISREAHNRMHGQVSIHAPINTPAPKTRFPFLPS